MSSGLLEYVPHRWILHGPASMVKRGHAQHHAEPRALISTPRFVIMTKKKLAAIKGKTKKKKKQPR